jgi:predicted secreted Zn-dependent protease
MSLRIHPPIDSLTWSYYRRVKTSPDAYEASTGYKLRDDVKWRSGPNGAAITDATVTVSIDPHGSWVVAGTESPELFEHEKLHYMIAALVGAELEQELKALSAPTYPALLLAQKQLAQEKGERARDIEQQYDDDTNHSQITAQQILWSARVRQWRRAGAISWP